MNPPASLRSGRFGASSAPWGGGAHGDRSDACGRAVQTSENQTRSESSGETTTSAAVKALRDAYRSREKCVEPAREWRREAGISPTATLRLTSRKDLFLKQEVRAGKQKSLHNLGTSGSSLSPVEAFLRGPTPRICFAAKHGGDCQLGQTYPKVNKAMYAESTHGQGVPQVTLGCAHEGVSSCLII